MVSFSHRLRSDNVLIHIKNMPYLTTVDIAFGEGIPSTLHINFKEVKFCSRQISITQSIQNAGFPGFFPNKLSLLGMVIGLLFSR
jgi:hypothetical protein